MYTLRHHYLYYFTALLFAVIPSASLQSHNAIPNGDTKFMQRIGNTDLRKALQRLQQDKRLIDHTPTELFKMGIREGDEIGLATIVYLVKVCKKSNLPINKDVIMRYAIQHNGSIELITYLLDNKIYKNAALKGEVRYDLTLKLSLYRIIFNELLIKKMIPKGIQSMVEIIGMLCILVKLLEYFGIKFSIFDGIESWTSAGSILQQISLLLNSLVLIYYASQKIGIQPGYLSLSLLSKRSKEEKEKLALLFLHYGANPNEKCFIIQHISNTTERPELEIYYQLYRPACYKLLYAIHLAIQYDLLQVVKALEKQGAQLNPRAIYIKDKLDFSTNNPKIEMVTLSELYHKESKKAQHKYALDFATPGSAVHQYLIEKGLASKKEPKN